MKKIILFFIVFVLFGCTNPQYFVIDDTKIIAFQNVSDDVVHLTIPEGITEIKTNLLVFAHLKTIQLPSSLSFLNPNIFIGCEKLTEIVISDDNEKFMTKNGVLFTKNENILLYYPEGKTSSSFIANNPSIGKKAFYNNVYLEEIILTNEVLKINDSAFEGCSNLKQITLSENLREIPDFAFKNCINLQEIEISPLVKTIGEQAFANTISLKSLMIPSHVFYIKNEAFFNFSTNQTIYFDHDGEFILWDSTWKNGCMAQLFFLGTIKNQKLYMALGDSVAAGHMSDNTMGLGYADYLGEKLVLSDDVTNFHNDFAKSGMTSSGLLYRLNHPNLFVENEKTIIEDISQASIITISIGANDLLSKISIDYDSFNTFYNNTEIVEALNQLKQNYLEIIRIIKEYNEKAKIYLIGYYMPLPYFKSNFSSEDLTLFSQLDETIQEVALQTNSIFVDISSASTTTYIPNPFNIHPGVEGYQYISEIIFEKMMENK